MMCVEVTVVLIDNLRLSHWDEMKVSGTFISCANKGTGYPINVVT